MEKPENGPYVWDENVEDRMEVRKLDSQQPEDRLGFNNLASSVKEVAQKTGDVINRASESIGKAIDSALSARDHVVMVRVNDESLRRIEALVQCGIFKSRSESAAFLISEGVKGQAELFSRIDEKLGEIERLRSELKGIVSEDSGQ